MEGQGRVQDGTHVADFGRQRDRAEHHVEKEVLKKHLGSHNHELSFPTLRGLKKLDFYFE